ncbi:MAG: hypothetical protein NC350_03595 [Corallococcus sp.]|nr:hypothetical protein [Corallococcus sp.]
MTEFEQLYTMYIKRDGADKLLEYLKKSDFFTAPASSKFHLAEEGGLSKHSVNVYNRLHNLIKSEYGDGYTAKYSDETIAVVSLLHDLCKVNYYVTETRNVKENGTWVQKSYYSVNERFPYGHGEKSVFLVNQYIKLTAEEAIAINWHMGGFDMRVRGGSYSVSEAYEKYKLALFLHVADLEATYLDEEKGVKR